MDKNQIIHSADKYSSMDVEYIITLREEGLHYDARLCDGRHSKVSMPAPTSNNAGVTCKRCLKRLKKKGF